MKSHQRGSFQMRQQCDQVNLGWDSSSLGPVGILSSLAITFSVLIWASIKQWSLNLYWPKKASSIMTLFFQVIWWIWILAPHHVWSPRRLLCHFLYRPPCPREKSSNSWPACTCLFQVMKLVRMRQQGLDDDDFEGKTYSRVRYQRIREGNKISLLFKTGKCDVEHERVGTAEYDLPPCEARGWVWGSQASLDKLLGSSNVQTKIMWRWGARATCISDWPVQWAKT